MVYVLTEHIMNGTVTLDVIVTGVEANTFSEAVNKLKQNINLTNAVFTFSEKEVTYSAGPSLFGHMRDRPLRMLK